jgi:hypothetical protein
MVSREEGEMEGVSEKRKRRAPDQESAIGSMKAMLVEERPMSM